MALFTFQQWQQIFTDDFLSIELLEPVTWQRQDGSGNIKVVNGVPLTTPVAQAFCRELTKDELFSERLVVATDRVILAGEATRWHFLVAAIAPNTARKGDIIIEQDGVTMWVVWKVQTMSARTRYRLTCIKQSALQ